MRCQTDGFFLRLGLLMLLGIGMFAAETPTNKPAEVVTDTKPLIAPPASWVKPQFMDPSSKWLGPEPNADQHWLLLEHQVNAAGNETFIHCVRQILNVAGVQNGSTLKIDFNPGYQTLTLHWARLWRGTDHLERLDADKIRLVRQERDLEQHLLDGKQTAVLIMDDVRVGDIVDYAYSIKGENPVFSGRFSAAVRVQLDETVERLLTRVLWPAQRRIYAKPHNSSIAPTLVPNKESVECVWDVRRAPGFHQEDSLPVWFDPEPWVQLSEFKSWAEVNQWALSLFQNSSPLSPELAQKISEWKKLDGKEQQVLAALRFVQDEVRYFGIEIGVSTEKPADPAAVFSRRFGDCKDKSLLFVTLARALGVDAYPVLVNTELRRTIEDWQPTAGCFDHCIATVQLDGRNYWLDPTAGYQRGPLAMHYLPDYGCGLVISPRTTALSIIPQTAGLPLTSTTEYFSLGSKARSSDLKVVTVAVGRDADRLRETFANTKRSDIEKQFTHFYADTYPGTTMAAPIEVIDNELENRFQTTEFYTIDRAWIKSDNDGKYHCQFYPFTIAAFNKKPVDTQRKLPLAVNFPAHEILRTEISLPVSFNFVKENKNVLDPAFSFKKQSRHIGNKLILEYEYQSLADYVPANRTDEYLQNLDKFSKCLGDSFVWR